MTTVYALFIIFEKETGRFFFFRGLSFFSSEKILSPVHWLTGANSLKAELRTPQERAKKCYLFVVQASACRRIPVDAGENVPHLAGSTALPSGPPLPPPINGVEVKVFF